MLSKEQLEKIANQGPVDIGGAQNPIVTEMAAELRSLREQLAALKALPSVVWMHYSQNGIRNFNLNKPRPRKGNTGAIPLFTAAKPAEIPRHIYSMLVNELRDVPAIGCKRELIIGVLNRHGITAEPVQFDPPATE
ncbi:TPA: polyphosphate kinase [Yersinia enterocolitica]|nr:polyphosphate kinase [Yersinia enterocolitica]